MFRIGRNERRMGRETSQHLALPQLLASGLFLLHPLSGLAESHLQAWPPPQPVGQSFVWACVVSAALTGQQACVLSDRCHSRHFI